MTGPSPWRLPSPRWGPDIGHSIWVHDRSCWLNNSSPRSLTTILRGRETSSNTVAGKPSRKTVRPCMNLTLVTAIVLLGLGIVLVFAAHIGCGPVQLLSSAALGLFDRR